MFLFFLLWLLGLSLVLVVGVVCVVCYDVCLLYLQFDIVCVVVVGFLFGVYMVMQVQLVYLEIFFDVVLVVGGFYGCVGGNLQMVLSSCMKGVLVIDVDVLVVNVCKCVVVGEIGLLNVLVKVYVYLLYGKVDGVVVLVVVEVGVQFYQCLCDGDFVFVGMQVVDDGVCDFVYNLLIVVNGEDCGQLVLLYLGYCGFDVVGEIFYQLFGVLLQLVVDVVKGCVFDFDQDVLCFDGVDVFFVFKGYFYLFFVCVVGKFCGLVVVLYGCKQNVDVIGEMFVKDVGFNCWVDVYGVVVFYFQICVSFVFLNLQVCWDWWGYFGIDYDICYGLQLCWLVNVVCVLGLFLKY